MTVSFESYEGWNQLLAYIAGGISIFANSLLIFFYLYIPEVRTFFVKLLFYLSICDWCAAISVFLPSRHNDFLCNLQSGCMQFFPTASFFWMGAVAFTMYMTVAKHKQYMWKYEKLYHFLIWPFPVITTICIYVVADGTNMIGWNDAWCWISNKHQVLNIVFYYIPLFIMLCCISILYILTIINLTSKLQTSTLMHTAAKVRNQPNTTQSVYDNYNRYHTLQRELIIYLCAIILCRIWGVIDSLDLLLTPGAQWINVLYCFFSPLQGSINTLLFFNNSIRKRIKQSPFCIKYFNCCLIIICNNFNKYNTNEYQPLMNSITKDTSTSDHINNSFSTSLPISTRNDDNNNNNNTNGYKHRQRYYHHHHHHHHSTTLAALISPPINAIEVSWPYPDAPQPYALHRHSVPNDIPMDNNNNFNEYSSFEHKIDHDDNNIRNKRTPSFIDKVVDKFKTKYSSSFDHDNYKSNNKAASHLNTIIDNKSLLNNKINNKSHNININDNQYEIYKNRLERLKNDDMNSTSSQYLPESLKTDWDHNALKLQQSASFGAAPYKTNSNSNSNSEQQRKKQVKLRANNKRIIELDESKFEPEILEEYSIFITTFNMADYSGNTPTLLDWMREEFYSVYTKKQRAQRHSKTVFDPRSQVNDQTYNNDITQPSKQTSSTNNSSILSPNISLSRVSMTAHMGAPNSPSRDNFGSNILADENTPQLTSSVLNKSTNNNTTTNNQNIVSNNQKSDFTKIGVIPESVSTTTDKKASGLHGQLKSSDFKSFKPKTIPDIPVFKLNNNAYPSEVDIFVFGAQELGIDSKIFGKMLSQLVGNDYKVLTHKRLSGIYIGILIRKSLIPFIDKKSIKIAATRTGIGNLYGNKGGVGVSFRVNRTSFCFVNAHLAASRSNKFLCDRLEDLELIVQGIDLGNKQIDFTHQFHVTYLLGDLNFRIHGNKLVSSNVINKIQSGNYLSLLNNDELTILRAPYIHRQSAYSVFKQTANPLYDATAPINKSQSSKNTDAVQHGLNKQKSKTYTRAYSNSNASNKSNASNSSMDVNIDDISYDDAMIKFKSSSDITDIDNQKNNKLASLRKPVIMDDNNDNNNTRHVRVSTTGTMILHYNEPDDIITRNRPVSAVSASHTRRLSRTSTGTNSEWDDLSEEDDNQPLVMNHDDNAYNEDDDDDDDDDDNDNDDEKDNNPLISIPEKHPTDVDDNDNDKNKNKKKTNKKKRSLYHSANDIKQDCIDDDNDGILNLLPMLQQFVEGPITFMPTYKFKKGTDKYTSKRIPAWCDRILWVTPPHPGINIKQLIYTSSSITPPMSDHRPVFSEFHITYNKSWDPPKNSQWYITINSFYLYLYPSSSTASSSSSSLKTNKRNVQKKDNKRYLSKPQHYSSASSGSNKLDESIVPYLTVHSPMLATCMRTTMGRRVISNNKDPSPSPLSNNNKLLCFKFNPHRFVVRYINYKNSGNGCLWIVIRDDNLLGDVDVIGASNIPLIDTVRLSKHFYTGNNKNKLNDDDYTKYKDVYVHFRRDVTYATSKKGYIEGHMKCEKVREKTYNKQQT